VLGRKLNFLLRGEGGIRTHSPCYGVKIRPVASSNMHVAATRLPKERLAQLDRLASRRGATRGALIREAIERLLADGEEPLSPEEVEALATRAQLACLMERAFGRRVRPRPERRSVARPAPAALAALVEAEVTTQPTTTTSRVS
jgi:predicted DNA-binding protein